MNKLMKKATILATMATMALSATTASADYVPSGKYIDQYDVKAGERYTLNNRRNVLVTDVYEKEGMVFGTNRTIRWIDIDTLRAGESTLGFWGNTEVYEYGTTFTWEDDSLGC